MRNPVLNASQPAARAGGTHGDRPLGRGRAGSPPGPAEVGGRWPRSPGMRENPGRKRKGAGLRCTRAGLAAVPRDPSASSRSRRALEKGWGSP